MQSLFSVSISGTAALFHLSPGHAPIVFWPSARLEQSLEIHPGLKRNGFNLEVLQFLHERAYGRFALPNRGG